MRKTLLRSSAVAASSLFLFAACGSGGSTGGGSSSGSTGAGGVVVATRTLAYDKTEYPATAGAVQIELDNQDAVIHNITLDSDGRLVAEANAHQKATATLQLTPGSYAFHCTIPGHNMHATFVVS